jgi:hypothetical protein
MNADLYERIVAALDEQHPDAPIPAEAHAQLRRAIVVLPADVKWAVGEDAPTVWALSATTLFRIDCHVAENRATIASRPVDFSAMVVELDWSDDAAPPAGAAAEDGGAGAGDGWREAHWKFARSDGSEHLRITGRTRTVDDSAHADRRELFARAFAERAGWHV